MDRSIDPGPAVREQHRNGTGVARVPFPILVCRPSVLRRSEVTPRMLRITVGGPEVARMHSYQCDDHVALVLPEPDGTFNAPVENDAFMLDWPRPRPTTRKYTIRRYDRDALELDLDFVRHPGGVAAEWAERAAPGDEVVLAGPPGSKTFPHHRRHYVFVVDFTALPAAARWLEEAPAAARTELIVLVDDPSDREYPLALREGDSLQWVDSDDEAVAALDAAPIAPDSFVFVAGEATLVRRVRVRCTERDTDFLPTGYWKRGVSAFDDD